MKQNNAQQSGQVLVIALVTLVLLSIFIPTIVNLVRQEAFFTVKQKKSTVAFHLAEAGIDRGIWKVKESTATFSRATTGKVITNYNFDKTFADIEGGYYRIKITSGTSAFEATIYAEGKDPEGKEVRAIKCVVVNQTIPGAIISGGMISWQNDFQAHWGPIMAQDNISMSATGAKVFYPRKFSRQVVTGSAANPRDKNGLNPPNTDNVEWWSDYDVPDLPVFDFVALRSSASASGTLNVFGCSKTMSKDFRNKTWVWGCNSNLPASNKHSMHFSCIDTHPDSKKNYVWYWDSDKDVVLTGSTGSQGCGLYGTVIVRGNLYIDTGDNLSFTGPIPPQAWKEYQKFDTSTKNQYPGDDGLKKNRATFNHGSESWTGGVPTGNTDVGIRGFIYVGKNLYLNNVMDFAGAVWVVGNVSRSAGAGSDPCLVFYDSALSVPSLNVVLTRQSWEEVSPDKTTAWVAP